MEKFSLFFIFFRFEEGNREVLSYITSRRDILTPLSLLESEEKMKKLMLSILLLVLYCLGLPSVLAQEATVISLPEEGYYFERIGVNHYHSARFHKYSFDGEVAYCIEPGVGITDEIYEKHLGLDSGPFDKETMRKIELIGYYGYGYPGHDTIRYRIATQELIWTSVSDYTFTWNDQKNGAGNPIDLSFEKNAIMSLVNQHFDKPSFDSSELKVEKNKTITLTDTNHVLNQYEISGARDSDVTIQDNQLIVKFEEEDKQIQLIKKQWANKVSFVYTNTGQTMATFGLSEPVISTIHLSVLKSKVKVQKVDSETGNPIKQAGIRFKIKDMNTNQYICPTEEKNCEYQTDINGTFLTPLLESGTYQLEEVDQKIEGYLWNDKPQLFTIDENTSFIEQDNEKVVEITFGNTPVKGRVELRKIGQQVLLKDNNYYYQDIPLNHVVYELYAVHNSDIDTLLGTYETVDGILKVDNLPLGDYYFVEIKSAENHVVDSQKQYFSLSYQDQYTQNVEAIIYHKNILKKGRLEFLKTDLQTGQPLADTIIQIIDDKTNQIIYEGVTNQDGKIIIDDLYVGRFYIIEKQPPENYEIYLDKIYFEIKNNLEQVSATMTNRFIVEVPATGNYTYHELLSIGCLWLGCRLYVKRKKA